MWNSSRRIALLGTTVVLVAGGAIGFAWVADWLPISFGDADSGKLVDESDLESELAGLTQSSFGNNGSNKRSGGSASDSTMFADQNEPIFEPLESTRSNEFVDRRDWANNRTTVANNGDASSTGTSSRETPFADFPSNSANQSTGRSIPDSFPSVGGNGSIQNSTAQRRASSPFDQETEPHQLVDQAGFAASNAASRTGRNSPSSIFDDGPARTLSDARSFPSGIRQVGNEEPASAKSPVESPLFESTQQFGTSAKKSQDNGSGSGAVQGAADNPAGSQRPANDFVDSATGQSGTVANALITSKASETPTTLDAEQLKAKLAQIDQWLVDGDFVSAHRDLSSLYWNQPEIRSVIRERIDRNSQRIYFSPQPHFLQAHEIQGRELLQTIAPTYKLSWEYLAAMNQVDPRKIRVGQKLKVIKGPFSAFVDLSDFELTIHCHGFYVKQYKIGVGKDNSSPTGKFKVLDKVTKPQYTDPNGRVIAGDDPNNPLGSHWIDIGNSFGIHGTLKPSSIGKAESAGCVRLTNEDVSEVYMFLTSDSEVVIRP